MLKDGTIRLLKLGRKRTLIHFDTDDKRIQEFIMSTPFAMYGQLDDKSTLKQLINSSREHWQALEKNPLVSVIVPLYNSNPVYLENAILSVLSQSYPEWELILVDDASPRTEHLKTIRVLQNMCPKRIKLFCRDQNGGISAARNFGIVKAKGDYVAFLDHDDVLHPLALAESMKILLTEKASFSYSFEVKLSADGSQLREFLSKPRFSWFTLIHLNYVCHFTVIKRSLLDEVSTGPGVYFHSDLDGAEDHDLFLRCSRASTFKAVTVPLFIYLWRMTPESTSSSQENKPASFQRSVVAARCYLQSGKYKFQEGKALHPFRSHTVVLPQDIKEGSQLFVLSTGALPESESGFKKNLLDQEIVQLSLSKQKRNRNPISTLELNAAILQSSPQYVLIMHPSIEFTSKVFLAECVAWLERFNEIGTVGASIIDIPRVASPDSPGFVPENYPIHSAYHIDETSAAGGGFRFGSFYGKRWFAFESREVIANTKHFMIFRRSDFLALGGFRADRFFRNGYDLDFCMRLNASGKIHVNLGAGHLFGRLMDECKLGYGEPEYTSIIEGSQVSSKIFQLSYNLAFHMNNIAAATDSSIGRC